MRIVFTCGVFDLLHQGHLNLFEKMREEAGINGRVFVLIHDNNSTYINKKVKLAETLKTRTNHILAMKYIADVIPVYHADPSCEFEKFLGWYKNDVNELIYMRGDDWKNAPGLDYLRAQNIPIKFVKYTEGISSTKLRAELAQKRGAI